MNELPRATLRMHPAWIALLAALAVLLVAFAPALWQTFFVPAAAPQGVAEKGAPWAIEAQPGGGTLVFGLRLPGSTLADAQALWGAELQLALMASRGQPAALEAYVERPGNGPISGRLVLSAEAAPEALARWRERATKETPVSADTRRIDLRADDLAEALRAPVVGIGFIPAAQLDAPTLRQRFGAPPEQIVAAGGGVPVEHWLYPERGLAIVLDADGRELFQYVAPAEFERRLKAPLLAATPAR